MPPLSTQQARLQDDLRGLIEGDVRCDDVILQLYATDASLFESRPLGVVWPRSTRDVVATVKYCAERSLPIHSRGSGTSSTGGAIGSGIVLDFTRSMRRILSVDGDTVTVQPGAVRDRFNDILKRTSDRFFAPSSGFLPTNTLGGILSTDVAGPRWLKYGFPHDWLCAMEVVTASGEVFELSSADWPKTPSKTADDAPRTGIHSLTAGAPEPFWKSEPFIHLAKLLETNGSSRPAQNPHGVRGCGYRLDGILAGGQFRPERLFAGAEGSLGVITKLKLNTIARPKNSASAVLLFDSFEAAGRSVETILTYAPSLCELIDRRMINMTVNRDERFARLFPGQAETAILTEFDDENALGVAERIAALTHDLRYERRLCFGTVTADGRLFAEVLKRSEQAMLGIGSDFQVVSLIEDIQIPIERLPEFLLALQNVMKNFNVTYALCGHIGQGQLRVLPLLDSATDTEKIMRPLADAFYDLVARSGGSIGSGVGLGLARSMFLPLFEPARTETFRQIKKIFDPSGLMNPGRVVGAQETASWPAAFRSRPEPEDFQSAERSDDEAAEFPELEKTVFAESRRLTARLPKRSFGSAGAKRSGRAGAKSASAANQLEVQLKWDRRQIASDVFRCTGCGLCRSRTPGMRMCPSFRHYPDEQASCRAKANLLRGLLDGHLELETLTTEETRAIGDQCIMCHCCPSECPTGTDVAKLAFRIQSARNAAHGLSLPDKFLSNTDVWLKIFSFLSCPMNRMLSGPFFRWLAEKCFDIAQGRRFPKVDKFSFLSRVAWSKRFSHGGPKKKRKVVLFVDTFSNYFDVKLAEAALKVLEHNGVEVYIPTRQKSSGHHAFSLGHADRADALTRHNVALLADLVRQGYRVVSIEPISAVCISREYLWLYDDPETQLVARNTTDLCVFLWELYRAGELANDFSPLSATVGYHAPCRTLALTGDRSGGPTPAENLLRLIPDLTVTRLERGCCGLAGPQGLKKSNYAMSLRLGMPLFLALREPTIAFGATECNYCRLQMEQGVGKPTVHPIKLLAASYRLTPELTNLHIKKPSDPQIPPEQRPDTK